ncbi:arsenate reductase (glutaredoxin) [Flavobacterium sp.]|jgi:arsenate reductase|uniref:arsenate reductase (glutaredoxin) n=1 Tax=Flavobacterium sp. TaxID=239 RepID=UPI0037BEF2FB
MVQILHNPRCGKSRNCIAYLTESDVSFEVVNYLENPLTEEEIKLLVKKLNIKPIDLVRKKEVIWKDNYKDKSVTDNQIINALAKHPILIERPIIIDENRAIIGREKDKIRDFI